ncbi:hypothetical protein MCEMRE182_00051 [Candidatus Nanopelagicaceae bacterium]
MSTTIKRVALVAVAALGLGVLSVAPSQAVSQADSLTLSAATASQLTGETATAGSATVTLAYLGGATTDSMTVSAFLVSAPATSTALPVLAVVETSSAIVTSAGTVRAAGYEILTQVAGVQPSANTSAVSAKFKVYMNAPTVAGTYVVRLAPAVVAGGGAVAGTAQTLTITVAANPASDTVVASATSLINAGETASATTDATVTASKVANTTTAAATIKVTTSNAAAVAISSESITATVSGPGLLGSGANSGTTITGPDAVGRAITVKNGDVIQVFPDGTSGVSTITISSAAGKVLATETLTFYGDIASIVTTVVKPVIGVRTDAGAVTAKAYDAAGVLVSAGTLYATSADTTIISNSYSSASITSGVATFSLTGVKAGSTTVVIGSGSSSTATTNVKATAAAVRVGGTSAELANVKVTTDKSSYAPGELAVITVTPVDAAGLALADDTYTVFATGGITSSYTLGSASVAISGTTTQDGAVAGTGTVSGSATYKVYLPAVEGDVVFSWTTGTLAASTANSAVKGSVTVNVSSASTSAAIDAANEAAQAASDATDAALAAADAADAATTKAQEAVDAVATLSAQVSKLITALKAQITTLTNLVIKIQKKVKA